MIRNRFGKKKKIITALRYIKFAESLFVSSLVRHWQLTISPKQAEESEPLDLLSNRS